MEEQEEMILLDFVYVGQRMSQSGRNVAICIINADGSLQQERWFEYSKKYDRGIGCIYTGAEFSSTYARGMNNATYKGRWSNEEDRIKWQVTNDKVESDLRLKKLESDTSKIRDLEQNLVSARKLFDSYRKKYDYAGMKALEEAVLQALRTPLRATEK